MKKLTPEEDVMRILHCTRKEAEEFIKGIVDDTLNVDMERKNSPRR
jgi:hypothetical protein